MKPLLLFLFCLLLWLGTPDPGYAMVRTTQEAPNQILIQSRHQLKDNQRSVWQVILFARQQELQLRLVCFPDRYHFRHPDPLVLETISGAKFEAQDDFPKGETVTNVGQFNLLPVIKEIPKDQRLILTLPLQEGDIQVLVPAAVIVEWQSVIQQQNLIKPS
ncbi:MAG: DUF3122 domain-containing protein [Cyanobacteria bacterium KgW148]|nr:DUF3122 domain-containing protein [Cyanobacteria bacterium KgW148]